MNRRLRRDTWLLVVATAAACGVLSGCVDRRFVITSDPPGAVVSVNGKPGGAAPLDRQFVYYGRYRFTLVRDGYETLVVEEDVRTPWYEYIPLDFLSENVIPWTIRDVRRFHYQMKPLQMVPPEAVLDRSEQLRQRGQSLGTPATGATVPPGAAGVAPAPDVVLPPR